MGSESRLVDLCEQVVDCPHSTPRWTDSGETVLRSHNIRDGRLDLSNRSFTDEAHYRDRIRRAQPREGDLVITREAPMGEVAMIPAGLRCCLGQRMVLLRPDRTKVDPRYLLYALQSPQLQYEIGLHDGSGSTVSNLRIPLLESLPIPTPGLPEQRRIASTLGALDDKIELNRRMSQTLESLACALFKSWFVDFDPVRAKAEGRHPQLFGQLGGAFPDSFTESAIGDTPSGWRVESLGDHVEVVRGLSYNGAGLAQTGIPLHNLNSVREGGGYKDEGIKFYEGEYRPRHLVRPGDVLVANTEQGHDRLLIGHAALVPNRFPTGLFSHHLYRVRPNSGSSLTAEYLCDLFNSDTFHDAVSRGANGTTVNMLPAEALQMRFVVVPPSELVESFSLLRGGLRRRLELAVESQRTLGRTRDVLLPELLSRRSRAAALQAGGLLA
jgi:type I restriction enzyme S subunit